MSRGLDHVAHAVRDLDAAGTLYQRLGFTVGARNRHPWGTHNRIVQLPGFFIELLTVAEPDKLGHDGFSTLFAGFTQSVLQRHEGLHLLLLESRDAAADAANYRTAGIAASEAMRFERGGQRPDGTPVTVGFSVAFVRDAHASEAGFAVCQQHYPENFWNPAFQDHANTTTSIAAIVLVAARPADHRDFLSAYTGERDLAETPGSITAVTPRGEIQVMDPAAFQAQFGIAPPDVSRSARLAALRFAVRDMSAAMSAMKAGGIAAKMQGNRLVAGPKTAMGATIAFELK